MIAWLWYSCVKGVVDSCLLPRNLDFRSDILIQSNCCK